MRELPEEQDFLDWVEAAPIELHWYPAKACLGELGAVFASGGDEDNLVTEFAQIARERETEVVEVPIRVGEKQDFQGGLVRGQTILL